MVVQRHRRVPRKVDEILSVRRRVGLYATIHDVIELK